MEPRIRYHGGECCGVMHVFDFHRHTTPEEIRKSINKVKRVRGKKSSLLIEIVLTDNQLTYPNLRSVIERANFRLVSRFKNPNSGNICNVFHWNRAFLPIEDAPGANG